MTPENRKTADKLIKAIQDNIIFVAFQHKLIELSRLIGGVNEEKISKFSLISLYNVFFCLPEIEAHPERKIENHFQILMNIFNRKIQLYTFSQIINGDTEELAKSIHSEWQQIMREIIKNE
ncbi:hypothetical protein ASG31_17695 [Chryseobacterium sp. Leaf404]|uniref:hypothetical protein n=1 Tax=unclassified Chryseobacterium TaxID=2593645 RepID=UPI0006F5146A|nr:MULTISPECIES: hypothetical protein [unclassified Chryseobacterium]KQT20263.1 hypothetical protein ASG31_17695 [Chryseobacterium sp. Leaf404]